MFDWLEIIWSSKTDQTNFKLRDKKAFWKGGILTLIQQTYFYQNLANNLEIGVSKILKKVETSKSKTPKKNKTPKKGINMVTPEIQLKELR